MRSVVSFRPIPLASLHGVTVGRLVFLGDSLMAVLAEAQRGSPGSPSGPWRVEAGFGPCSDPPPDGFATLQEVSVWVSRMAGPGPDRPDDGSSTATT
ncbi:hypothetical protein [Microvirga subterranea]|uniref:Uncharacterized protein n=1 Tax=Microvirga subterranea TaxID=186651 RepID=A0A370HDK7_9HYPH|nr:hypothetical protein [Microvirga subterranea]RDI55102.1 hypothetical protein DES45_11046 [Microvirga subterranea]